MEYKNVEKIFSFPAWVIFLLEVTTWLQFSSVQLLRHVQLFVTPWTAAHQASLSTTNSRIPPKPTSIESVMPSNHLIPFSSCPQSFPVSGSFQMSQLFASGGQNTGVSVSTSVLPMNNPTSPLGWTGWISCSPRNSQESVPTPQFKTINSSALSFLYSPNVTSTYDYWKKHSLARQISVDKVVSLLLICCLGWS